MKTDMFGLTIVDMRRQLRNLEEKYDELEDALDCFNKDGENLNLIKRVKSELNVLSNAIKDCRNIIKQLS